MNELQAGYLEAMDIPVWVSREAAPRQDSGPSLVRIGPGRGASLFVCANPELSSSRIAADVARALPEPAVWAWPLADNLDKNAGIGLEEAVAEKLFTTITVFGTDLAARLFGAARPVALGSARIAVAPGFETMAQSGAERRECWRVMLAQKLLTDR